MSQQLTLLVNYSEAVKLLEEMFKLQEMRSENKTQTGYRDVLVNNDWFELVQSTNHNALLALVLAVTVTRTA